MCTVQLRSKFKKKSFTNSIEKLLKNFNQTTFLFKMFSKLRVGSEYKFILSGLRTTSVELISRHANPFAIPKGSKARHNHLINALTALAVEDIRYCKTIVDVIQQEMFKVCIFFLFFSSYLLTQIFIYLINFINCDFYFSFHFQIGSFRKTQVIYY